MNNIANEFQNLISTESNEFSLILDVMVHSKKETGRHFLNMMNQIVDYYLTSPKQNKNINFKIIHVPACEPWARELFLRFLIHKIALFHNKTTIDRFKIESSKTINCNDNKEVKRIKDRNSYFRAMYKKIENNQSIRNNDSTNLIIIKNNDLKSTKEDKNPWVNEYAVSIDKISNPQYNLCIDSDIDTRSLATIFENATITLENIFIFHTRNKVTRSYSRNQLERLNRYDANIKNCFVFSFSDQPFVVDKIKTFVKNRLVSIYNQIAVSKFNDFNGFTTISKEESDYIFNRKNSTKTILIDPEEREYFSEDIEVFIDTITPNLKFRNQLCLCFNSKLQDQISQKISEQIHEFKYEMCSGFFSLIRKSWDENIIPLVKEFISNSSSIAFIIDKETPYDTKKYIIDLFQKPHVDFKFFHFESLKRKKGKSPITADRIIIFQYRSPNGLFFTYPNIFDPLVLNKNQKVLIIINKLTHTNFYDWDTYWYEKSLNALLYSDFREVKLGWKFLKIPRPLSEGQSIKTFLDEDDVDNSRNYPIEKCKIYFKNGIRAKEISLCENVIFQHNGTKSIDEIRSILELPDISLQQLDEITEIIKSLINERILANNNAELIIRNDSKLNLSSEEIKSSTELWKILLKKKVERESVLTVFNDIFQKVPEHERISINAFSQWYNLNSSIILPRSNKDKNAVLAYLGFESNSAYPKIINKKKLSSINGSRRMNSLIESFLKDYLFTENTKEIFDQCKREYSDFMELIEANTYNDFVALKSLILQEIDLKKVDSIEYDKN